MEVTLERTTVATRKRKAARRDDARQQREFGSCNRHVAWTGIFGIATFLSAGWHYQAPPILGLLFLGLVAATWWRRLTSAALPTVLAITAGFAITWLGLLWAATPATELAARYAWLEARGATADVYFPMTIVGLPFQQIHLPNPGGGPEYLPLHKGLLWLVVNFGVATLSCLAMLWWLPRKLQRWLFAPLLLTAILGSVVGYFELCVRLD